MKCKLLIALIIIGSNITFAHGADIKGKVLNFGIFPQQILATTSGVSGIQLVTRQIISLTNQIPAKTGICFGITYQLSGLTGTNGTPIGVVKIVKHPPMTKPDGKVSNSSIFLETAIIENGQTTNWTGYRFNHSYELVPGLWHFEMQLDGLTFAKQDFMVYQE